ncbi:FHA domain-containing protein [Rutstroemia sp. NJR-2017a WRK4]|nr:FHA domain-containing protein [Rutstroemia sp. NJR-2017a WRK4]
MTAVANPPSFQQINRSAWGSSANQGGINSMNADEVARMFMPRKSVQRANSSSSLSSNSSTSSTSTLTQQAPQANGVPMSTSNESNNWGSAAARKKVPRTGPWPSNKSDAISGVNTARPASVLTNGNSAPNPMNSIHQPAPMVPSQHIAPNGAQQMRPQAQAPEGEPMLYLLSMNGTFDHKRISVPFYPESLRIGRQTNAKTVPSPANGFFDSKVLSRQHAEIWADRSGKIWIRDVKSSNGTFVNGARLSAENKDSDPHELQSQDHLELGIDIVSEDQKTVVHHKVAAKVEHAGFIGATNNVMEMNFGDLNPANGTSMMLPSQGPMRGRTGSQGSVGSNGRMGPPSSAAGSQMSAMGQQRPMNFWLTPVTTEQIVKRLSNEMRTARLQNADLVRADTFFGGLLSKDNVKEVDRSSMLEGSKATQVNGSGLSSFRAEGKARFSDPPAPPPQQPLPEKPDVARPHGFDPASPTASLRRSNTEKAKAITNGSPIRQEVSSQIITLVEALASAKKEIDTQSARMRDLEDMLQKERQARESAEEVAKRLEHQTPDSGLNGSAKGGIEGSVIEDAFNPPSDDATQQKSKTDTVVDAKGITDSSLLLEKRLEGMLLEMQELRSQMESFKKRAETAESERDADRKSLAEMVEKIRSGDLKRTSSEQSKSASKSTTDKHINGSANTTDAALQQLTQKPGLQTQKSENGDAGGPLKNALQASKKSGGHDPFLYHSTPYASMVGVVLIGMGLMAYLNGWQPPKLDR